MSAQVKDASGNWRSVGEVRVKTGASTWNYAQSGWVKTGATTWQQWFWAAIRDSFARTTSGSLGVTDTAQTWVANSGVWFANGSVAQSNTAASSYPVASIDYGSQNAIVAVNTSQGTGPAVWVSGSNNWYAAIHYATGSTTTVQCNCTCNGHYENVTTTTYNSSANCQYCGSFSYAYTNPAYSYAATASTTSSTTSYAATATTTTTSGAYVYSGGATTYSATDTTTPSTYYCVGNNAYDTTSCPGPGGLSPTDYNNQQYCRTDGGGGLCSAGTTTRTCNSGDAQSSGGTGRTCYSCPSGSVNGPNPSTGSGSVASCYTLSTTSSTTYSCPSGGTLSGTTCYVTTSSTTYSCPSGGTLSGTTCYVAESSGTATACYTCPNPTAGVASTSTSSVFFSGGTYPNCDGYGSTCQTCTVDTVAHNVVLLRSVGGVVTTLNSIALSAAPAGIKLISTGDTLTWQAYSNTALTNALGTQGSLTISGPSKSNFHGIVKAPTVSSQGSTVDNFSITG
jgi:hypothetical protein